MGAGWSFIARDQGCGDCAQARAEGIDGQHDYAMAAGTGQAGFPDLAPQRIHG